MKLFVLLAVLGLATPVTAAEEVMSDDGTILKIEKIEDALSDDTGTPAQLHGGTDKTTLPKSMDLPLGLKCGQRSTTPQTS